LFIADPFAGVDPVNNNKFDCDIVTALLANIEDQKLSETYPVYLYVPSAIHVIVVVKNRFPVLYLDKLDL